MMGRSHLLQVLLLSTALAILLSHHGFGSEPAVTVNAEDPGAAMAKPEGKPEGLIGLMDYSDPKANTNPRAGYILSPPPPPPPPPPSAT